MNIRFAVAIALFALAGVALIVGGVHVLFGIGWAMIAGGVFLITITYLFAREVRNNIEYARR